MAMPRLIKLTVITIALCLTASIVAVVADWLNDSVTRSELVFALLIYGVATLIPWKITQRSNAARYGFLIFVAATYLNWLRGLAPFPPWSSVVLIVQIPVIVMLINWLFMSAVAPAWFRENREQDEAEARVGRINSNS